MPDIVERMSDPVEVFKVLLIVVLLLFSIVIRNQCNRTNQHHEEERMEQLGLNNESVKKCEEMEL